MSNDSRAFARADQHVRDGGEVSVYVHAFTFTPGGDTEYTDAPDKADGWSSYVRLETPDDPDQPFDVTLEADHPDRTSAEQRATALARAFLGDGSAYETY